MAADRGRPREFKDETQTISLTISKLTLTAMDRYAKDAGMSRARLINEMLCMANILKSMGFIEVNEEGTEFHQFPKKQTIEWDNGNKLEWDGLNEGMSFFVQRDQVVKKKEDEE